MVKALWLAEVEAAVAELEPVTAAKLAGIYGKDEATILLALQALEETGRVDKSDGETWLISKREGVK